jgi:hypothetical protein
LKSLPDFPSADINYDFKNPSPLLAAAYLKVSLLKNFTAWANIGKALMVAWCAVGHPPPPAGLAGWSDRV